MDVLCRLLPYWERSPWKSLSPNDARRTTLRLRAFRAMSTLRAAKRQPRRQGTAQSLSPMASSSFPISIKRRIEAPRLILATNRSVRVLVASTGLCSLAVDGYSQRAIMALVRSWWWDTAARFHLLSPMSSGEGLAAARAIIFYDFQVCEIRQFPCEGLLSLLGCLCPCLRRSHGFGAPVSRILCYLFSFALLYVVASGSRARVHAISLGCWRCNASLHAWLSQRTSVRSCAGACGPPSAIAFRLLAVQVPYNSS